jgi:2-desacetyl-2-hydroxyethyl bacteriochlorophyllide A dehydrogenase
MRAVICQGPRHVSVETVPDPRLPSPHGVIVQLEATAICGSDLHLYHGDFPSVGQQLGHEGIGTVVEAGAGVTSVRVGDRVLLSAVVACGTCVSCRAGDPVCCTTSMVTAVGTLPEVPGAQAELIAVDHADAFVRRIDDGLTVEQAVLLTDILPTGFLGAQMADINPGDSVAVFGLGPVGTMAVHAAKLFGPSTVYAVDIDPDRLREAQRLGAVAIDAREVSASAQIMELTKGRGVSAAIEAIGHDATILEATSSVAAGGTVSVVGVNLNMALPFPMGLAFFKRLTVRAAIAAIPKTWPTLVPLLQSGAIVPDAIFTHHLPLSEAPRGYELFDAHDDGCRKVLLDPTC